MTANANDYRRGSMWRNPRTGTVWMVSRRTTRGWGGAVWITLVSRPTVGRGSVRHYLPNELEELGLVAVDA